MTKNTYGTGSFVLMNIGASPPEPVARPAHHGGLVAGRGPAEVAYALEGSIFVTGAAVQWLRDGLGLIASAAEIGPLAESVPDTGGAYLVPALTGLGSPWWDPLRPRHARRRDPGRRSGPAGPGGGGGHGLPDPRCGRRHAARHRADRSTELRVDGGAVGDGSAAPAPGRPARRAGGPGRGAARRPPSAPPGWPGWPRACGDRCEESPATGGPTRPSIPAAAGRRWGPRTRAGGGRSNDRPAGPSRRADRGDPTVAPRVADLAGTAGTSGASTGSAPSAGFKDMALGCASRPARVCSSAHRWSTMRARAVS